MWFWISPGLGDNTHGAAPLSLPRWERRNWRIVSHLIFVSYEYLLFVSFDIWVFVVCLILYSSICQIKKCSTTSWGRSMMTNWKQARSRAAWQPKFFYSKRFTNFSQGNLKRCVQKNLSQNFSSEEMCKKNCRLPRSFFIISILPRCKDPRCLLLITDH